MATELTTGPRPDAGLQETLGHDFKEIIGKTGNLLKEAGHSAADEIAARRAAVTEKACHAASATQEYVKENPWKIVGLAIAAGTVIGAMLSRR